MSGPQTGLRIGVDGAASLVTWTEDTALAVWREATEGRLVEIVSLPRYGIALVIDEEGKCQDQWEDRLNAHGTALYAGHWGASGDLWVDGIVGPVIIIANETSPDGDSLGLEPVELDRWLVRLGLSLGDEVAA
jgi:hypothetical protein